MAHLGFRRTVYKSGGHDAQGRIAYITRERFRDQATQQLTYISKDREDCVFTTSRNLPAWCHKNSQVYFRAAERYEGAGWVAFEELKITLPLELTHRQNLALVHDLVESIAGDTLPCVYAFHNPTTMDQSAEQPHLHLIFSRRETDAIPRTAAHHFKRWQGTHPERGGARKDPAFRERLAQRYLRVLVSDAVNLHLERAGVDARVHPDTLRARGIDRTPEPKLRPSESRAYRNGVVTARMQEVLDVRMQRTETRVAEDADAQAYWAARKETIGLTEGMDPPAQLAMIQAARALVRDYASDKAVVDSAVGVEVDDRAFGDLGGEQSRVAWAEGQALLPAPLPQSQDDLAEDLLGLVAQMDALTRSEGHGGAKQVRLWEREYGQGF